MESPRASEPHELSESVDIPIACRPVAAFVGRTERGPVNQAVTIRNYNHYRQIFGGHAPFGFVSYSVQQFFLHGGKTAVIVRVANRANRALIRIAAGAEALELQARHPGSREYIRVSVDYDGVDEQPQLFNLIVQRLSRPNSNLIEDQEIFSGISIEASTDRYVADVLKDSRLVSLRGDVPTTRPDATRATHAGDPIPYLEAAVLGSDGAEITDYDIIGSKLQRTGLFSLEAIERIDFLCIPPSPSRDHGITTFIAAGRYCEQRRALLIWDPPATWGSAGAATMAVRRNQLSSRGAATYFPWVRSKLDRVGLPDVLPACGAVAGVLAAKAAFGDWENGGDADPFLKISMAPAIRIKSSDIAALNRLGVNVLVATEFGSSQLQGNVMLSATDGAPEFWGRLDKRRLQSFILNSIEDAASETSSYSMEEIAGLEVRIRRFLEGLRQRGALAGEVSGQAYTVRTLLTPSAQFGNPARIRVGFAMNKPNEFLLYDLILSQAGCEVRAVPALEAELLVS